MLNNIIYAALLLLISTGLQAETFTLSETIGGKKKPDFIWEIKKQSHGETLIARRCDRTIIYELKPDGTSSSWRHIIPSEGTDYTARLNGTEISITGKEKGRDINKILDTEGLPWMQAMTYSLSVFARSNADAYNFCVIRPDNLDIGKMTAQRSAVEKISMEGKECEAHRITVSLSGWLSKFWSSDFWFRKSDCMFVKYNGKQGLSENTRAIITLIK